MTGDRRVGLIARTQKGLISVWQLYSCGLTDEAIRHRVARGWLVRVRRSVYRVAGAPILPEHPVIAAWLAAKGRAHVSHRAATVLHGLTGFVCNAPELVTVTPERTRLAGVRNHDVSELPPWHVTTVDGVGVTTAARTFVDLADSREPAALGASIDDARRRRLVTISQLLLMAEGRRGIGPLMHELDRRVNDKSDTDWEANVYWALGEAGLPLPMQQYMVVVGAAVYLLDHAYPPPLAIDLDLLGFIHAIDRTVWDRDSFRRARLRRAGWLLIEPTTAWTIAQIVEEVEAAIIERTRTPLITPPRSPAAADRTGTG